MFKVYWDLYRQLYHKFTAEFERKKFEHRSLFGEVMERSIVAAFLTQWRGLTVRFFAQPCINYIQYVSETRHDFLLKGHSGADKAMVISHLLQNILQTD